jgi:hypothetical protein
LVAKAVEAGKDLKQKEAVKLKTKAKEAVLKAAASGDQSDLKKAVKLEKEAKLAEKKLQKITKEVSKATEASSNVVKQTKDAFTGLVKAVEEQAKEGTRASLTTVVRNAKNVARVATKGDARIARARACACVCCFIGGTARGLSLRVFMQKLAWRRKASAKLSLQKLLAIRRRQRRRSRRR